MTPLVSIVIPTYNRARDLERALKSVIAQTHSHWEALIVDNHSSDNTSELVERFGDARMKLIAIHNDGVIAASRNLGVRRARGEYVAFLDSDDWWTPQKLEMSLRHLQRGADVVYHDLFRVTKHGQQRYWRKARTHALKLPIFDDLIARGNVLNNSSVVIRRNILQSVNGLSEDRALIASEDYDTWLRVARITNNFEKIPCTLGYYWAGGGNYWTGGSRGAPLERIIASLDHLESIYADDIRRLKGAVYWLDYARGRAHYRVGSYALAKNHLQRVDRRRAPPSIYLKSRWMLIVINLRSEAVTN